MATENQARTILVGDDDFESRSFLATALQCQGFGVELAEDGHEVLACLNACESIAAVVLDVLMPGKDGIQTLREIRARDRSLPVIMLSGASSTARIVEAMKCGATDFLGKPLGQDDLRKALCTALERRPDAPRPARREKESANRWSSQVRELYATAARVGASEVAVLIQGETGTGKEVLARHIHAHSGRSAKPFLKLNCAALPSELVESELFGYERGAFTGAFQRKPGMFELANGGTLLLDEIGDMDFKLQAKLLQVLQDHEFQRLGGKETVRVDVRVIAATHKDIEKAIEADQFRQDLYYRLNVVTLQVPPLRDRKEDVVALAEVLLRRHATGETPLPTITPALQQALLSHDWPGNVRELENAMRRLLVLRDADLVARDLRARAARVQVGTPILEQVTQAKQQAETEAILAALRSTRWNRKKAAMLLKIDYKALLYKMKKLGMEDAMPAMPGEESGPPAKSKAMTAF